MNTARIGSSMPLTSRSHSKLSRWRPKALRATVISINSRWGGSPPAISLAITIKPAHVPKIGLPSAANSRIASIKSYFRISLPMVVLSPPGIIRPSISFNSSTRLIGTPSAPALPTLTICSVTAP
ncbi:hypothetical protein D3C72_1860760 [compost metagenome]